MKLDSLKFLLVKKKNTCLTMFSTFVFKSYFKVYELRYISSLLVFTNMLREVLFQL